MREKVGYIAAEADVTVANKAVSGDSESVSVSGLLLRRREEVLKNINRSEKHESLFLSLSFLRSFSRVAPFWCHVTNCFHGPVIIFPAEDSHGERETEREKGDPNAAERGSPRDGSPGTRTGLMGRRITHGGR